MRTDPAAELQRKQARFSFVVGAAVVVTLAAGVGITAWRGRPTEVSFSALVERVRAGAVARVRIEPTRVLAELRPVDDEQSAQRIVATRLPGVDDAFLYGELRDQHVDASGHVSAGAGVWDVVGWLAPLLVLFGVWRVGLRRMGQQAALTFGSKGAKIYDHAAVAPTTFADVAGADDVKAELQQVVDFLRRPDRYRAIGARMPRGVLLVGAPGTGKTLFARAVAGEAGVPFFSISGSEFVELFVGLGASRIRALFEQARERAPCIVFIDEIDAIGKSRAGVAALTANDEREQTLNQLLVEMDGFTENTGVILMAATNRPEVLDPALVRAGRFDRQVVIDRPDVAGRRAILALHARRLPLAASVDLDVVARRTPGMVGADLRNVVNEAALAAVRAGHAVVDAQDFEDGLDRVLLGLKRSGARGGDDERQRVALHEAGHAVVARSLPHADPVHRVSIVARSVGALGVTLQLPTHEHRLSTQEELEDQLAVLLGGRAAEQALLSTTSTGCADDLRKATALAHDMVARCGMDHEVGPVSCAPPPLRFFAGNEDGGGCSDALAARVDAGVRRLLDRAADRATAAIEAQRPRLELLVARLLEQETLSAADLEAVWRSAPPSSASSPSPLTSALTSPSPARPATPSLAS